MLLRSDFFEQEMATMDQGGFKDEGTRKKKRVVGM